MDVFLVPIGGDRYELYCEVPDMAPEPDAAAAGGFFHRLKARFHDVVAEAERERRLAAADRPRRGWLGRLRARAMRLVAESIAEQRLLWHLRGQSDASLLHPDDVDGPHAIGVLRKQLGRDHDKHQFWLIFDSVCLLLAFLLVPIPGPNLLLYYFAFRVVGHYFSLRGARQGLNVTTWRTEPRAPLTELRQAMGLDPASREQHVNDIALRLQLEHLATFFRRTAIT
jgi:hypothetical protein